MKKLFFLVTSVLVVNFTIAQEATFGLKAGANYSTIFGDFTDGFQPRLGFQAGGFVIIEVNNKFYFQPEVFYSSQGVVIDRDLNNFNSELIGDANIKINTQQNYLSIPIVAGFHISNKLALEVGPQVAFLLHQKGKIKESGFGDQGESINTDGEFRLDYGLAAGLSYALNDYLFLQPRVYLGIANNLRDNSFSEGFQNRNLSFQLSVGYIFN